MMIVCFRPGGMRRDWFARYCHLWMKQAGIRKEALIQRELTDWDIAEAWDRINMTPGRAVVWTTPAFIPHQSFFEELDYFLSEGRRIVALRDYTATFQPRADRPYKWEPDQLEQFPLVFQLAGQKVLELPVSSALKQGPWHWLGLTANTKVAVLEQFFRGSRDCPLKRSALGTQCAPFWGGGEYCQSGQLILGETRQVRKARVREDWLTRMDAWEAWQNVKTDPNNPRRNTMYSTQSFASDAQDG